MEKRGEVAPTPPNAASKDAVDDARRRVEALGFTFHDAIREAGLSRNVGYTLLRYTASTGSLRKLEDWLVKQEAERPKRPTSRGALIEEWAKLGEQLSQLDPPQFARMLDGLRELVKVELQKESVIVQMFRPNPDRRR